MRYQSAADIIDHGIEYPERSASKTVEACLDNVARSNSRLNAFTTVCSSEALEAAQQLDEEQARSVHRRSPLFGVPIAVKDNIDVAGIRRTVGSDFFRHYVPATNATVVDRLIRAGAVVIGKAATHEFMYGATTNNPHFGPTRNPWDIRRIPGGSSGGSAAAVAADMCWVALGTDSGGSVRIPASLNGVSGLRPTHGVVSNTGVFPMSPSVDTTGPIARSVADLAAVFSIMVAYDRADPWSAKHPRRGWNEDALCRTDGIRVGIPTNHFFENVQDDIHGCVRSAIARLGDGGADLGETPIPGAASASKNAGIITRAETFALHRMRFDEQPERFGRDVLERLKIASRVTAAELVGAYHAMREWRREVERLFEQFDVVATPTATRTPPLIDAANTDEITNDFTRLTYPWSLAGVPALSIPCGFDANGMPVGLQLIAPPYREDLLFQIGGYFQLQTTWHRARPQHTSALETTHGRN